MKENIFDKIREQEKKQAERRLQEYARNIKRVERGAMRQWR